MAGGLVEETRAGKGVGVGVGAEVGAGAEPLTVVVTPVLVLVFFRPPFSMVAMEPAVGGINAAGDFGTSIFSRIRLVVW
jgi:hypothetical protein